MAAVYVTLFTLDPSVSLPIEKVKKKNLHILSSVSINLCLISFNGWMGMERGCGCEYLDYIKALCVWWNGKNKLGGGGLLMEGGNKA